MIARPVAARTVLPAWFRSIKGVDHDELPATNDGLTVKRCLPCPDAMSTGWIMPLAATLRLDVTDDGKLIPPLNRPNPVFEVMSGVVDTDVFATPGELSVHRHGR